MRGPTPHATRGSGKESSFSIRLSTFEGFDLSETNFTHAMIELGVSAAVILALGITLKLLGRSFEVDESR
jgi:hypothetical protein